MHKFALIIKLPKTTHDEMRVFTQLRHSCTNSLNINTSIYPCHSLMNSPDEMDDNANDEQRKEIQNYVLNFLREN